MNTLPNVQQRLVYIVTYSRANTEQFPIRRSFSDAVVEALRFSRVTVQQCVVCLEGHVQTGSNDEMNRYHHHYGIKTNQEKAMGTGAQLSQ